MGRQDLPSPLTASEMTTCKPLTPLQLSSFILPCCDGFSFALSLSYRATRAKDRSVIDFLGEKKNTHNPTNKRKYSPGLVEDAKIKSGAKADPKVISELLW